MFGVKKCLILGGIGQCIYVLTSIGPALNYDGSKKILIIIVVIIGAAVDGLSSAIILIASATYAAACSAPTNRGFFFGFFYATYLGTVTVANLISWSLLTSLDQNSTITVLVSICSLASVFSCICLFFIKEPLVYQSDED